MATWARRALALLSLLVLLWPGRVQAQAAPRAAWGADPPPRQASASTYYEEVPAENPPHDGTPAPEPTPTQQPEELGPESVSPDQMVHDSDEQDSDFQVPVASSGDWINSCRWFAEGDIVLLTRTNPKQRVLAVDTTLPSQDGLSPAGDLTTGGGVGFRVEPGTRVTLGYELWRDRDNRDHDIEISYLGPFDWHDDNGIKSSAPARLFTPRDPGFLFLPGATPPVRNAIFGGFAAADDQTFDYGSNLNSLELNLRTTWRLDRDLLVAMPDGSWSHQMNPGVTPSLLCGLRVIQMNETFNWHSERLAPNPLATGDYDIDTTNNLVGFQVGAQWTRQEKCFSYGGWIKAGGYLNFAHQHSTLVIVDSDPMFQNANSDVQANQHAFTFAGDAALTASYHLSKGLSLRGELEMMWIQSVAAATSQIPFHFGAPPSVNLSGNSFFMGISTGLEYAW